MTVRLLVFMDQADTPMEVLLVALPVRFIFESRYSFYLRRRCSSGSQPLQHPLQLKIPSRLNF
jgi:hypothetical protein